MSGSATNVDAIAVNTIDWLADTAADIVVPVYQRQYRWDIGACEQLLADVLAVADSSAHHMHFLGSILSADSGPTGAADGRGELVLIDGQQRITTLMLLVAALHHTVRDDPALTGPANDGPANDDPALAARLERVLLSTSVPGRTRLRPHRAWADVFERVVLAPRAPDEEPRESRFDDNYAFFRSRLGSDEVPRVWRGLQKLEHVAITLGAGANAQQIFESLNSTGEPLRDAELVHNYVLMGLSHNEQREIEDAFWLPIESATGDAIGAFWRDYLVMTTGREVAADGPRGVYDAFRQEFPRLDIDTLRAAAAEWLAAAQAYRVLLDPSAEPDAELRHELSVLNVFGRTMHPLVLRAYRDSAAGAADRASLIATLHHVQALLLRRAVIGLPTDRLVARLCRARLDGEDALVRAVARITPSDERVRVGLRYGALPHARTVLGRLAGVGPDAADTADTADGPDTADTTDASGGTGTLVVDHIAPLAPADDWTGDGERAFADLSDDEQNSLRALAPTLGNLTLLEEPLADQAFEWSFPRKRDGAYPRSTVAGTRALADTASWGTAAIAARTRALSDVVVRTWPRAGSGFIDDDGLTPILDATRRRGWPRGWQREFDYVEYRGEHWEVKDVKALFNRVFKRLWADGRPHVEAYSARRGGPVYSARAWTGHWDALDDTRSIYMGWDSRYMLTAVQGLLTDAGLAAEVFVKYSYIGDAMDA